MLLAAGLLICSHYDVTAQTHKKHRKKAATHKSTTTMERKVPPEKPINEETTGVMGKDTIRLNEKGMEINKNYNTGTELPPSSGDIPKK